MYKYFTFEEEARRNQIKGRVLITLEFDKIVNELIGYARTSFGKKLAAEIVPTTDSSLIVESLSDTYEAYSYINKYGNLPLGGFANIGPYLSYGKAGGCLTIRALLDVAAFISSVENMKAVVSDEHADMINSNLFSSILSLESLPNLEKEIRRCIANEDEMNDRASEYLYSLRREKKDLQQKIRVIMDRIIRESEDILREAIITLRGDRYCVPVKTECKNRLPGIIHDSSASGQTVFIEPMSVVEANNRISEIVSLERDEIARILQQLTEEMVSREKELQADISIIACIDFASAKGQLAISQNAIKPAINSSGNVHLVKARHPLIDKKKVVPVDIDIGKTYKTLVITGPNTGGKTVSLKTCGLMTLMAQAGMMIPCNVGTEVSVFDRILADIGDEQSIEQSLSTFSAHMSNIVFILKNIRGNSLVLLDELGAGTDPAEGAALAVSILDELISKNCITMATTHYKELKAYAIEKEGVMNASCEFDTETLSPTYRLVIGMPGSSNAFIISRKLGIPERIINNATANLSEEELSFGRLIEDAEAKNKLAASLQKENECIRQDLRKMAKELEEEKIALKQSKTKILNNSRSEMKSMLQDKEDEINELLKKIKEDAKRSKAEDTVEELNRIRRRLRAGVKDLSSEEGDEQLYENVTLPGEKPAKVVEGEQYFVPSLNILGKALSTPNRSGKLRVEANGIKYFVTTDMLVLPTKNNHDKMKMNEQVSGSNSNTKSRRIPVTDKPNSARRIAMEKVSTVVPEIMLIGMRAEEARSALDRYIDDCSLTGINKIRIVHGKGSGVLRSIVDEYLRQDPRVESHRLGISGEGEDGVTIATLV